MQERKEFIEKAKKLTESHIGNRTAFWFNIDFVEFKAFNYHFGMPEGNRLLQAVQDYIEAIPEVALFTRVFSDEFAFLVIADEPRSDDEMVAIGNSYIYAFLETQREKYPFYNLKLSCGICPVFSDAPMDAIDNASIARKQSRDEEDSVTAVIYTEKRLEEVEAYRQREKEIYAAMQEERVSFQLQPQIHIHTGEIIGAEALARLVSRSGELIYPSSFIDIMEENGSVVDLDFMMLEKACEFMADRLQRGLPTVRISVNLSRLHLLNPSTADLLHAIVQRYDIPCHLLEFELTETVFLQELDDAKILTEELHRYGYAVSLDDFGSGYAGLNLCQEADFDIIKLDRSFLIGDEKIRSKNEKIIPCIIDMMNRLGIKVICEGAELPEQVRFLMEAGCDVVQGYYFSRPLSPMEFYRIYEEQHGRYPLPAPHIAPVLCEE